ncbi:methionine synthase II [Paenibacillus popilliae ATCC 14706]|uniref:Methionine synthase II n=1 Tax=Paenibacillus popilliae ATCC 14706 TaxID=1212764 RepID=M9LY78_PAEPP|nr:methionine synthase II [Paenibacillus popilliae ATCC 14706]
MWLHTEGNIGSSIFGEFESAFRGLRAWHVTNRELAGTRETLSLPGTSGYAVQVKTKQEKQKRDRKPHQKTLAKDTIPTRRGGSELKTKLVKIAQAARERPKEQFTCLIHLLDEKALYMCHQELKGE